MTEINIEKSWQNILKEEFEKPYFQSLTTFVKQEYATHPIYPPGSQVFSAFDYCPFDHLKVVIVGQDPYHGAAQANGLCFSVTSGVRNPPSLNNIFKELKSDIQIERTNSDLSDWAKQGVLMLNSVLTVRGGLPASHKNRGWEQFTNAVLLKISEIKSNIVFILWGRYAKHKGSILDARKHLILTAAHPSPYAANNGFFGCQHFSKTNEYLKKHDLCTISW